MTTSIEEGVERTSRSNIQGRRQSKRTSEDQSVKTESIESKSNIIEAEEYRSAMTRFFKAVNVFYFETTDDQEWKAVENPFGLSSHMETSESLKKLLSPLRPYHVLDSWTPYEIQLFEMGIIQFGKQFHLIQQLIPMKSTRNVILFYYMWKKCGLNKSNWGEKDDARDLFGMKRMKKERDLHGIIPTTYDLMSDEDDSTSLEVKKTSLLVQKRSKRITESSTLLKSTEPVHDGLNKIKEMNSKMTDLFDAIRNLYAVTDSCKSTTMFDLRMPNGFESQPLLSILRPKHILDTWSTLEIAIFEAGLRLYGKHFHQVSALLELKSTHQVISFYYMWKKYCPEIYMKMKQRWPDTVSTCFQSIK